MRKTVYQILQKETVDFGESAYEFSENMITVKIPFRTDKNAPVNTPVNAPVKLTGLQEQIISLFKNNPNITYPEIVLTLEKDRRTISRNIKKLKESGLIKRIGTDKKGYWQVK